MKCDFEERAASALAQWFMTHARDLPFRRTRDPYQIWVSEVMLQQTRVAAMLPAYERFIRRFPDVQALALADEEEVLTYWQGLGYYSRARNLHRAARSVCETGTSGTACRRARFPDQYDELRTLPGIGPYTAAAVASICRDEAVAAVDGNVRRVLSRLYYSKSGKAIVRIPELAGAFLKGGSLAPSLHNQAVMELGALVCLPGRPRCEECPLTVSCGAFRHDALTEFARPTKQRKTQLDVDVQLHCACSARGNKTSVLLIRNDSGLFLKRHMFFPHSVREGGREILRTYGFAAGAVRGNESTNRSQSDSFARGQAGLPVIRHSIMNWDIRARVHRIQHRRRLLPGPGAQWIETDRAADILVSSLGLKVLGTLA